MLPIVLASILALAICLERLWFLQKEKIVPGDCLSGFQDLLKRKKYTEEELRSQASSSLVGWVCFDILKKASSGREDMGEAMEVSLNQATYILERYLTALGVIASVSPLLGLLGTVIGMIDVFDTITDTGSKSVRDASEGETGLVSIAGTAAGSGRSVASVKFQVNASTLRFGIVRVKCAA